ncbi:hypothetical protein C9374_005440 [Naegleria lovaniensis]|uniref:Sas10 C-terminal domain-containing protein n=1 Tax=Naegleria lovaniensis TaxID=51637 RepID=A0AA88GPL3_NAELO|nr:uncharacterized protein C9374_005440 [Naegleria lovaniensis]KAG2382238.1 hypothetical protein C9374_005440 [Naegleria lovaniensis]
MPNTSKAAKKNKAFAQLRKGNKQQQQQSETEIHEEPIIDADTFQSETDKFQSKKIADLRKKAGLLEKDKDRYVIQPLINEHENSYEDDDEDEQADSAPIDKKLVKQTVDKVTKKQKDESDDEDDDEITTLSKTSTTTTNSSDDDSENDERYKGAFSDDEESDEDVMKLKKKALMSTSNNRWKRSEFFEGQAQLSQKTHTNRERKQYEEEEEEVKRIQEERAKRLSATDYLDDFMLDKQLSTPSSKKKETKVSSGGMSLEEKLSIIQKDAPEFMELLVELKNKLSTVKDQLHPLMSKVMMGNLATSEGLSYLETKYHLILSYCTNILFYMLLKSSGKSVKDHPVIDQLVELRLLLEKIKPIDERMKYQIDKLVKMANDIQDATMTYEFKANPDRLMKDDEESEHQGGDDEDEMAESDEDYLEKTRGSSRKLKTSLDESESEMDESENEGDAYVAPKMMAIRYDDGDERKAEKTRKKAMERIEKGKLLKELKAEFGDAPEERESVGTENRSKYLAQIEEAELDARHRLLLTKKDKKKIAEELKIKNPLAEMDSFHEFTALQRYAKSKQATSSKLALAQYIGDADEALKALEKSKAGPIDEDGLNEEEKAMLESGALTYASDSDFDDEEEEDYEEEDSKKRKRRGFDKNSSKKTKRDLEDETLEDDGRDDQGKRKADNTILKNRGIAAHKKVEQRNPRLRLKNKFNSKTGGYRFGKLKSEKGYSGEKKIQANTVRSRKIKS